jgi:hypothetical protein
MNRIPFEGLLTILVWVSLAVAYRQLSNRQIGLRDSSAKPPLLRSDRLPFKFGLRTLLFATTMIALMLGLVTWVLRR